jgi:hypothetical protein
MTSLRHSRRKKVSGLHLSPAVLFFFFFFFFSFVEEFVAEAEPATVIYVGHIPYGFFEKEMKEFFGQFGKCKKVKIARSSRTARSKGYGWVQFENSDVAAIACKTMDGYMMNRKKLVVNLLEPSNIFFFRFFFFFLFFPFC